MVKNVRNCDQSGFNTGRKSCWADRGVPRAILLVPAGKAYDCSGGLAALLEQIQTDITADLGINRVYPIQGIVEIKDTTKAPNEQTFTGDGSTVVAGENPYDLSFQWTDQGFCLLYALRKIKGLSVAFMLIDSFGQLIATDAGTPDNEDQIQGIPAYSYTNPFTWATTNTAVAAYITRLVFRPEYVNDTPGTVDFTPIGGLAVLEGLNGLLNVDIQRSAGGVRVGVSAFVKAVIDCADTDLYDTYAEELTNVSAWQVRNVATKNPIAILSVTIDDANRGWIVKADGEDPNYDPSLGNIEISLVGPTELFDLEVEGYEANWLAV
jgi:hypothetical protein